MSAFVLQPQAFTVAASSDAAGTTAPAKNLNVDEGGLVWRSNGTSGIYVTVQLAGAAWDALALVGYTGPLSDTIRIRAGSSASAVAGTSGLALDTTFTAWTGVAPASGGALAINLLGAAQTAQFVRIDITTSAASYVQAKRLVIGTRVSCDGVDIGSEQAVEDGSNVDEGTGYTTVDRYGVRTSWKVTVSGVREADFYSKWWPFLLAVGKSRAFVFVPDTDVTYMQNQAVFGRMTSSAKGSSVSGDTFNIDMNLLSCF